MKKFIILSLGFEQPTPEVMEEWNRWFEQLKDNTTDMGSPFGPGIEISADGNSTDLPMDATATTGYRIIEAEDMEEAKKLAANSPSISGIRIYELMNG